MTKYKKLFVNALDRRIRNAVAEDIKHAKNKDKQKKTRSEITEVMTIISGEEITKTHLNNWTAGTHVRHRFPIIYLPSFMIATGQRRTFELLIKSCSISTEINLKIEQINRKINKLKSKRAELKQFKKTIKGTADEV